MKGYKNGRRKKDPVFFLPRSVLLIYHTLQSPSIFYPCVHASVSGDLQRHLLLPSQSTITPLETSSPHASSLEVQNAGLSILLPPRHLLLLLPNAGAAAAKHPVIEPFSCYALGLLSACLATRTPSSFHQASSVASSSISSALPSGARDQLLHAVAAPWASFPSHLADVLALAALVESSTDVFNQPRRPPV